MPESAATPTIDDAHRNRIMLTLGENQNAQRHPGERGARGARPGWRRPQPKRRRCRRKGRPELATVLGKGRST
eukprot:2742700-Alexandrium_andersonii.AAC.1